MTIDLYKDPACAKCKYAKLREDRYNPLMSVYVCTRPNIERVKQLKSQMLANVVMLADELGKTIAGNDRLKFYETSFELEHQLVKICGLLGRMRVQCGGGWTDPEDGYLLDCTFMEPKEEQEKPKPKYIPPGWEGKVKHGN